MKTLSRKELVAKSVALFKERTEAVLHATSDGQFFIFPDRANMHANSQEKKLTVYDIERKEVEEELKEPVQDSAPKGKAQTVKQIKAFIADTEDVEVLSQLLADEKAGEDRVTAKEAIENRISEVEAKKEEPKVEKTAQTATETQTDEKSVDQKEGSKVEDIEVTDPKTENDEELEPNKD